MLASAGKDFPEGGEWVFEPKYDGIRIIALITQREVALLTRNGLDKCRQFPEITSRLLELARKRRGSLVLDGEVVALDEDGAPARFQDLQGRMHLMDDSIVAHQASAAPVAFIAFDILVDGDELLVDEAWAVRRKHLERALATGPAAVKRVVRASAVALDSPGAMLREAKEHGWEGIMAKRRDGVYEPGRRVRHWQKLKLENQQEFVVGGWTEPRNSRTNFGALLLGYHDKNGALVYAGHTGTGFSFEQLTDIGDRLERIERKQPPFAEPPKTNERAHWVTPKYVAEVRFNEWTSGGMLRQPVFLGMRDDKDPASVVREPVSVTQRRGSVRAARLSIGAGSTLKKPARKAATGKSRPVSGTRAPTSAVISQLREDPKAANATIVLGPKAKLAVTNLGKVFFPVPRVTKGRLLEFYAEIAPYLLPALADRPLVLKRYPNGIKGMAFYQQKAPDKVPPGIRVEEVTDEGISTQRRLIGGDLATLLYIAQLGAVSTDPWHSRVQSIADADYSIVDLDPGPRATFKRVVQVARWVKEELDELGLRAVPKTSGASGIHIVLPLPAGASYELSRTLAELVARRVNEKHPKETTVHRWVKSRPEAAVYVDYLQNIRGKTVASVYSARAETHASVSTPLKWSEVTSDLDPRDFTVETLPKRLKSVGDLWAEGMRRPNRLPGIIGGAAA